MTTPDDKDAQDAETVPEEDSGAEPTAAPEPLSPDAAALELPPVP